MFKTISEIKAANKAIGNYWFSPETMRFRERTSQGAYRERPSRKGELRMPDHISSALSKMLREGKVMTPASNRIVCQRMVLGAKHSSATYDLGEYRKTVLGTVRFLCEKCAAQLIPDATEREQYRIQKETA